MDINITRPRYVIVRDDKEIYCGDGRNKHFVPLDKINNCHVVTYCSEARAKNAYYASSHNPGRMVKFVQVQESIFSLLT